MSSDSNSLTRRNFWTTTAALAGVACTSTIGFNRLAQADESGEMITQLAKFKLNMDNEEEAVEALETLCAAVEEHEPGVLAYICHRSTKEPEELVFFEVYQDADALKEHGATEHLGNLRKVFAKLFRPPLEITRLDRVGGFSR